MPAESSPTTANIMRWARTQREASAPITKSGLISHIPESARERHFLRELDSDRFLLPRRSGGFWPGVSSGGCPPIFVEVDFPPGGNGDYVL